MLKVMTMVLMFAATPIQASEKCEKRMFVDTALGFIGMNARDENCELMCFKKGSGLKPECIGLGSTR